MLPKVTIQIPTYNQKQYIKKAVDSALAQTYENLEIIVSDDCSPDYDIFYYLKQYKENPEVIIHRNVKNFGRVGNYRSTLYNLISGEWFVNLDGDDRFENIQFLNYAMDVIMDSSAKFNIVCFEYDHNLDLIKKYIKWYKVLDQETILVRGADYIMLQKHYQSFMHANTMVKSEIAKRIDFYNRDILTADFFSALKLYTQGDIILSSKKIFNWNNHGENVSHSISLKDIEKEKLAIFDFIKYARGCLKPQELTEIVNMLHFFLYQKVFRIYKGRKKDLTFYKYVISNMKLNKYYIRFLLPF